MWLFMYFIYELSAFSRLDSKYLNASDRVIVQKRNSRTQHANKHSFTRLTPKETEMRAKRRRKPVLKSQSKKSMHRPTTITTIIKATT